MIYIHFIVNPISGNGKHDITVSELRNHFPQDQFKIEVDYTKYKQHATELTKSIMLQKPDYIVACGGDGTINEVASCLVNSNIKLGVFPVGSGNGLASNLNIPKDLDSAMAIIRNGKTSAIDVGTVNEHYFFSNSGIGIDAMIIKNYEQSGNRTLVAYVKAAMRSSFKFIAPKCELKFNDKSLTVNPFMLFISNSNEMGYKMSLTPKASLNDGYLDMILIPTLGFFEKLALGLAVVSRTIEKFQKAQHALIKHLTVEIPDQTAIDAQIDGEFHHFETNKITFGIVEKGLLVLTE